MPEFGVTDAEKQTLSAMVERVGMLSVLQAIHEIAKAKLEATTAEAANSAGDYRLRISGWFNVVDSLRECIPHARRAGNYDKIAP